MYIAIQDVNTSFGQFKKGDLTNDKIGAQYSAFVKVEEEVKVAKAEVKEEIKEDVKKSSKKDKKKEELLTEISDAVEVEITEE